MGKDRSFAAKVAKSQHLTQQHCPTCGEELSQVKIIDSSKDEVKKSWRFKEKFVHICKCNEKDILS